MNLLDSVATVDDVIDRINKRHEELFHKEEDGTFVPLVCTFCDHYLIERNDTHLLPVAKMKQKAVMKLFSWEQQVQSEERIPTLETYYSFSGSTACLNGDVSWLEGLCFHHAEGYEQEIRDVGQINTDLHVVQLAISPSKRSVCHYGLSSTRIILDVRLHACKN